MIDYHIHLERGPYTLEWLMKFWDQAQRRGLSEIGITEHAHEFREFKPVYRHLWEDPSVAENSASWIINHFGHSIDDYFLLLEKGRQAGIPLKVGLECDYFPQSEEIIRSLLGRYDFDYVLGSVHFLDTWSFDWNVEWGWHERNTDEVYLEYLGTMTKMAQANLFDVLAHLDVIKVHGHRAEQNLDEKWQALLNLISEADLAIEVSTAGWRKPVGELYPHPSLLKEAARLHIPITISSDAHDPWDVGDRWHEAVTMAKCAGYDSFCSFKARQRTIHSLPSF